MDKIKFFLDGREVEAEKGSTILEAARKNGIDVPTLCHDPRLKPYAACRICLVEVEGARGPIPACANQVSEGMKISTKTDNLTTLRRVCLELLASDHYGDCVAPCKLACPAGIDIQGQLALIADGQYKEALKLIKESNPLPVVCGRVCPRFCEKSCRRNLIDEPVAINMLKRFVADFDMADGAYIPQVNPPTGHKIAIVGGGPAGLSTAFYLALEGHKVTIFDSGPELGGMLRYGIPEYRLPKAELDKEIATITGLCEGVHLGVMLGKDFTIDDLKSDGFEAVFVALGAQAGQSMRIEGEDMPGVLPGVTFLRDVVLGKEIELGDMVVVIGGGNTAMDAARTSLRLGAKNVLVVYRRSKEEMPANPEEIDEANHEGVMFKLLTSPVRVVGENGRATGIECVKMELGEPDASGRRRPVAVEGSEFIIPADTIISAIGQSLDIQTECTRLALSSKGYIEVNKETMQTSIEGVFSGGDCASGPATVVQAVDAGKRAAHSINLYLNGQTIMPPVKPFNSSKGELNEIDTAEFAGREKILRARMPMLSDAERRSNFREIETGLSEEDAQKEAMRCLSCGCTDVFDCELRKLATEYGVEATTYEGENHRLPISNDHPHIVRDNNKCILCGRCARICSEVMGIGAISFVQRGFKTVVQPSLGVPLEETQCESCGQCVSTCPTGALTVKTALPKPGPWLTEDMPSVCPQCGVDCALTLRVKGDKVVEVTSPAGNGINEGNLCKKGAFGTSFIRSKSRLKTPLVKQNGRMKQVDWDEALAVASKGLKKISSQYGGEKLAVLASPKLTNEENYLAQKLARVALNTSNIGNSIGLAENDALNKCYGKNSSTCSFDDMLASDLIIAFDSDVCTEHPIASLKIKEAVRRGSRLIIVSSEATRLDSLANMTLRMSRRMIEDLLQTVINYIFHYNLVDDDFVSKRTLGTQILRKEMEPYSIDSWAELFWIKPAKIIEFIHMYVRAKNPMIIVNADNMGHSELTLLANLALVTGNVARKGAGIIALRGYGNSQGQIDMGVSSRYLPGQHPVDDSEARNRLQMLWGAGFPENEGLGTTEIIEGIKHNQIRGLVAIGSSGDDIDPDLLNLDPTFSVLITPILTEDMAQATVVLPGTTFAETNGTFTSSELRVQRLHSALSPLAGKPTRQLICELSTALGYDMDYSTTSEVFNEITKAVSGYGGLKYEDIGSEGVMLPNCDENSIFISPKWFDKAIELSSRKKK